MTPCRPLRPLWLLVAAIAVTAPARADEFDTFRIPTNSARFWSMGATGSSRWSSNTTTFASRRDATTDLSASGSGSWWRDSEAGSTTLQLVASGEGMRDHTHSVSRALYYGFEDHLDGLHRQLAEDVRLGVDQRTYPGGGPWCVMASLSAFADFNQSSDEVHDVQTLHGPSTQVTDESDHERNHNRNHYLSAQAGFGAGRVRNATGVCEARLLEERLHTRGVLRHALGAQARERLAELMYARDAVDLARQEPAPVLWNAIERILRDDGALPDSGLAAGEWFRLVSPYLKPPGGLGADLVPPSPVARARGWNAGLQCRALVSRIRQQLWLDDRTTVSVDGTPVYENASTPPYSETHQRSDRVLVGVGGECHRPVGLRLQLDASGSALADVERRHDGLETSVYASAAWLASDRWLATLDAQHARSIDADRDGVTRRDDWHAVVNAGVTYFLTDAVAARATLGQTWLKQRSDAISLPPGQAWFREQSGQFALSLTYRFRGAFAIPALAPFLAD